MDANEQIQKIGELLEEKRAEIAEAIRKQIYHLEIPFTEVTSFDIELAEALLDNPEDIAQAGKIVIRQMGFEDIKNFHLRFFDLPSSATTVIRNIRSDHIGKFLQIEGVVRQKSDVRPQVTIAKFECPSCGNVINVPQLENKFSEPARCNACGRKGRFKQLEKELVDAQGIVLEENPEKLEGGEQPKRINLFLKEDLVSPLSERKTNPGNGIVITGQLKEVPILSKTGAPTTRFDLMIEVNHVKPKETTFHDLNIEEEELAEIERLSKDPNIMKKLIQSVAPSIYGHELIKEALILQLFGGVNKKRSDGVITRGDLHLLLIGDPGAGKCVSGDTKILTSSGNIRTMKEVVEDEKDEEVVALGMDGNVEKRKISRYWSRKAPEKMIEIETTSGNKIKVTKEHPLFTTDQGFIYARRADSFKPGEFIATPEKIEVQGEVQLTPTKFRKSKANNKVIYRVKPIIDEEFARCLGYLIGDGYVRKTPTGGVVSFTNKEKEVLRDFEESVLKTFNTQIRKRKTKNCFEYTIRSVEIVNLLGKIDKNIAKSSGRQTIPKSIFLSKDKVMKSFLQSFFECEGHVNVKKKEIEISTKSKRLAEELKLVLLRFGIVARLKRVRKCAANTKEKRKRTYYCLVISGEFSRKFSAIGFRSQKKKKALEKIGGKTNTNVDVIPNISTLLKVLRNKYGLVQSSFDIPRTSYQHYERGDRNPSKRHLKKIAKQYTNKQDPLVALLHKVTETEVFWDKIKAVKEVAGKGDVYDIEVPEVHNFVANGIVIHNSQMLKRINIIAPKSRYVSGKGASGAGLTAAVVKDEFLGGWSLEAGALVLASDGLCCIDELDKMSHEDRSAMHEALEQQTVSISKANIQATLTCKTTVLAAANPKFGRFDPYSPIVTQIDLPPPLISRFDLIFPIRDLPDETVDTQKAQHILSLHQTPEIEEPEINTELLRKYIAHAKSINPVLTDGAIDEIKRYYVEIRNKAGGEEGANKTVPITARQLEALVRMSEALSRIKLAKKVTRKEAKTVIDLLHKCLSQVGVDPETGKIDTDILTTGISSSQRGKIMNIKEIINDLEKRLGKVIPIEDVVKEAGEKDIDKAQCEEAIEKLKRSGDIFEPKPGVIQKL